MKFTGFIMIDDSPATMIRAGWAALKRSLPTCTRPLIISYTSKPFVTYQGEEESALGSLISMRALSKYTTSREPPGLSAIGSVVAAMRFPHTQVRATLPTCTG